MSTTYIYTSNRTASKEARFTNFLEKSYKKYNTKYDYSLSNYIDANTPIEIICHNHGSFWQSPNNHLALNACKDCNIRRTRALTQDQFLEKAVLTHNNKYDYSLSKYTIGRNNIKIICPTHGIFTQSSSNHLSGKGCPLCAKDRGFGYYVNSNDVDSQHIYYLYNIKLTGNGETFYKIGITNNLKLRHRRIAQDSGYSIELIGVMVDTKINCNIIERKLLKKLQRLSKYSPINKFSGWTECYT